MPSLPDTAVIIFLGLLIFGPKGLAQIARQVGKLMGEFRRASNEFRMQMEEELRISEQTDRQKQIAAVEAAAPVAPALEPTAAESFQEGHAQLPAPNSDAAPEAVPAQEPLPIATSGEMSIMPPATGLPEPRSSAPSSATSSASLSSASLSSLIDAVPKADAPGAHLNGDHSEEEQRPMRYTNHTGEVPQDAAAEESLHG
jgi:sec-independent protein translocase protein TatB